MKEKILLIDGHSILNRAYYGLPELTNSEGLHTNAIYGFLNILFKMLEEEDPDYLTVAFDLSAPTFRHKMYDAYKGTRKPMPGELREQVPVMKDVLEAMGVNIVSKEGYEADDILGTLARKSEAQEMDVTILSGDRDLLQLATDHICIRIPKTKGGKTTIEDYYAKDVEAAYQLTPPQIIELKALMGDSADNIPGLPGVGEKTATKLLLEYGTAENAYAHVEEIKPKKAQNAFLEHYDLAVLSRKLATIHTDSPVELDREKARVHDLYTQEAYEFFKELEFKNFLSRFQDKGEQVKAEEQFHTVTDLALAEELFKKAEGKEGIGLELLEEGESFLGLGLSYEEEGKYQVYGFLPQGFLTRDYLMEKAADLCGRGKMVASLDIKAMLRHMDIREHTAMFDAGIAAYLLNPLKSQYTYDDIAKEYLGEILPAKEDLIGKLTYQKAAKEETYEKEVAKSICYMAYVALKSRKPLLEALEDTGMK